MSHCLPLCQNFFFAVLWLWFMPYFHLQEWLSCTQVILCCFSLLSSALDTYFHGHALATNISHFLWP